MTLLLRHSVLVCALPPHAAYIRSLSTAHFVVHLLMRVGLLYGGRYMAQFKTNIFF